MNIHGKFWLLFFTIYTAIIFTILFIVSVKDLKIYGILSIPGFIYFIAQFIINYFNLTENESDKH